VIVLGVAVSAAPADVGFGAPVALEPQNAQTAFVGGDFNGDGRPDVAVSTGAAIEIRLGQGDGTFTEGATTQIQGTSSASPLAAADLNGDGKLDLVVSAFDGPIAVLLGNGDGTFGTPIRPGGVLNAAVAAVVADFDGDGRPDIAVADYGEIATHIYLNGGGGAFTEAPPLHDDGNPTSLAVGDVNKDGRPDLITGSDGQFTQITVAFNEGGGTFGQPFTYGVGAPVRCVRVADLNGDGWPDIVALGPGPAIIIKYGAGPGSFFAPTSIPLPANGSGGVGGLAIADMNGDGQPDIVAATSAGDAVLLSTGGGAFRTLGPFRTGFDPVNVLADDVNGDGNPDVVTSDSIDPSSALSGLFTSLGRGDGSLRSISIIPVGSNPLGVAAGDLDGDGRPDLAVPDAADGHVHILHNDGDGEFTAGPIVGQNIRGSAVAVADFNGDGRNDIVTTTQYNEVALLINNGNGVFSQSNAQEDGIPETISIADVNGDGAPDAVVNVGKIDVFLSGGFRGIVRSAPDAAPAGQLALADFNGDGKLDVAFDSFGVQVMMGKGDGSFGPETMVGSEFAEAVGAADVNGDGKADLVTADFDPHPASRASCTCD